MVNFTKICAVGAAILLSAGCIIKDPPKPAAQPECPCACPAEAAESDGGEPAKVDAPAAPAPLSEEPASV